MELLEKLSISTKTTGFSSPARDYVDKRLDLNDLLIQNIYSTFYFRWDGENVLGLERGDYLLVDRSVNPSDDSLVIYTKGDDLGVDKFSNINPTKLWGTILWKITRIEK
jgi:hypothetical protein